MMKSLLGSDWGMKFIEVTQGRRAEGSTAPAFTKLASHVGYLPSWDGSVKSPLGDLAHKRAHLYAVLHIELIGIGYF